MPVYETLPDADITCLDYSLDMMERARRQAKKRGIENISFMQGDVGKLPFLDESFDLVLSLNGFHAFPDKEAAYCEVFRVLKPGGIFCRCFYVKGENKRTDWLVDNIYTPKGYFTPPYETVGSLEMRLKSVYRKAQMKTVEGMAAFRCRKGKAAVNSMRRFLRGTELHRHIHGSSTAGVSGKGIYAQGSGAAVCRGGGEKYSLRTGYRYAA